MNNATTYNQTRFPAPNPFADKRCKGGLKAATFPAGTRFTTDGTTYRFTGHEGFTRAQLEDQDGGDFLLAALDNAETLDDPAWLKLSSVGFEVSEPGMVAALIGYLMTGDDQTVREVLDAAQTIANHPPECETVEAWIDSVRDGILY